jgi:hypothetical protein
MSLRTSLTLLVCATFLGVSYSEGLYCSYIDFGTSYQCDLTIQNPTGLNNFVEIRGTHSPGRGNDDVEWLVRTSSSVTTNVPSIICDTFPNLLGMELWVMGIERVDEYSFKNCKNIFHIDVSSNRIVEIDERSFSQNLMLTRIFLFGNQLTTLPENLFSNQHNLNALIMSRNNFTDFPLNTFGSLRNLVRLDLDDGQLTHLRVEWFRNLINLQTLNLFSNQLEDFPRNVFNPMQRMHDLNLNFNQLKVIHSDWFGILPNFRGLNVRGNQINAVDERFIDNTGVNWLGMLSNICVNDVIIDDSPSRQNMRNMLQTCFDNFQ